jgi:hypothetical protein
MMFVNLSKSCLVYEVFPFGVDDVVLASFHSQFHLCFRRRAVVKLYLLSGLNVSIGLVPATSRPSSLSFKPENESGASLGLDQGTSRSSFVVQTGNQFIAPDLE